MVGQPITNPISGSSFDVSFHGSSFTFLFTFDPELDNSNLLFPGYGDFSLLMLLNPPSCFHWCCYMCQTPWSEVSGSPEVKYVSTERKVYGKRFHNWKNIFVYFTIEGNITL